MVLRPDVSRNHAEEVAMKTESKKVEDTMNVDLVSLSHRDSNHPAHILAVAVVRLRFDNDSTLTVSDLRVLRNRGTGQLWVAPPTRFSNGERTPLVLGSKRIQRMIEDAVLEGYEKWTPEQPAAQSESASSSVHPGGAL
jgi:DNA-binding cell septation regulator SpoVG